MSTNYYLRRKPSLNDINDLKDLIDKTRDGENFKDVLYMVQEMYSSGDSYDRNGAVIHLGKRAGGWKFLWCTNVWKRSNYPNGYTIHKLYELTKKGIRDFIMQDEYVVVDEYDEIQDKTEFLNMAFNWDPDGYDSVAYHNTHNEGYTFDERTYQAVFKELGYEFDYSWQSDFYSDGLRFSVLDDFT